MTYDENEDYNGPAVHRRGPFLFMAAIVGVILVAGFGAAVSDARADPSQTVLPADGVLSITRSGDVWSVTTDGIPTEVKIMSPRNEVLCGVNYGMPCTTVTTFTSTGDCAFIQVDGLPGFNSSDPYICLGGTPSLPTTDQPSTGPSTTPSPSSTATQSPSPSPTSTSSPTSTPEQTTSPSVPSSDSVITGGDAPTRATIRTDAGSPAQARLADTGADMTPALLIGGIFVTAIGAATVLGRRAGFERFGSEK